MVYYVRNNYQSLVLKNEAKQNMPCIFELREQLAITVSPKYIRSVCFSMSMNKALKVVIMRQMCKIFACLTKTAISLKFHAESNFLRNQLGFCAHPSYADTA